jgi:hypothetical protein
MIPNEHKGGGNSLMERWGSHVTTNQHFNWGFATPDISIFATKQVVSVIGGI